MARLWACFVTTVACATPQISETPLANSGGAPIPRTTFQPSTRVPSPALEETVTLDVRTYACAKAPRQTEPTALLVSVSSTPTYLGDVAECVLAADGGIAIADKGTIAVRFHVLAVTKARCSLGATVTRGSTILFDTVWQTSVSPTADSAWDCIQVATDALVERVIQRLPPGLPLSPWR